MSNDIDLYAPARTSLPARDTRRANRAIGRMESQALVRRSAIDIEVDLAVDKIEAQTSATGSGMASVVRVAQAQRQLEQLAPEAAPRLAYLADAHALGVGDVLSELRRNLRRR